MVFCIEMRMKNDQAKIQWHYQIFRTHHLILLIYITLFFEFAALNYFGIISIQESRIRNEIFLHHYCYKLGIDFLFDHLLIQVP